MNIFEAMAEAKAQMEKVMDSRSISFEEALELLTTDGASG